MNEKLEQSSAVGFYDSSEKRSYHLGSFTKTLPPLICLIQDELQSKNIRHIHIEHWEVWSLG